MSFEIGVEYNYIDEPHGEKYAGVIAQDLEKVLPHLVRTDDSLGNKLVDYQALIPYLIEAIKEQQEQIEGLTRQLSFMSKEENIDVGFAKQPSRKEKKITHQLTSLNNPIHYLW